ncbi:MAG: hypothetical protein ACK4E0_05515 [Chitinophagaceae bacterium]|jgi:preprotein translocase subunit SecY
MKVTGIIFIVLGILAIAFNAIAIPQMEFSSTGDDAYDTGYNIGLFLIGIVGVILFIVGIILYRAGSRREREKLHQMYQQQRQQQPQEPRRYNTY